MDLVIRHVAEEDVAAVHEILTSPHVVGGSMRVPLAPLRQTRERLAPARGVYQLVAEAEGPVATGFPGRGPPHGTAGSRAGGYTGVGSTWRHR